MRNQLSNADDYIQLWIKIQVSATNQSMNQKSMLKYQNLLSNTSQRWIKPHESAPAVRIVCPMASECSTLRAFLGVHTPRPRSVADLMRGAPLVVALHWLRTLLTAVTTAEAQLLFEKNPMHQSHGGTYTGDFVKGKRDLEPIGGWGESPSHRDPNCCDQFGCIWWPIRVNDGYSSLMVNDASMMAKWLLFGD